MKKALFLLIALIVGTLQYAMSAPLKNIEIRLTQPNGEVIHCYASGDEFYNYLHDANGFTIVKGDGGYYFYAMHDSQGQVVPSPYLVNSVDPASVGLPPYVKISKQEYYQRRQAREQYIKQPKQPDNRELNHGRYNNLVVFIRFAGDTYHTTPFTEVDSMFNASNYEAVSMHNFYHHCSYNQLDLYSYFYPEPDGQTILSYEDIHPKEYYMPYDPVTNPIGYQDGQTADREFSMLERAINYVADQVPADLALDYNNDGMVDNVVFVIKGEPGEWASLLWPHRWCIYDRYVYLNNLRVYDFNLQLEIGGYFTVGTLCHEMCHSLGAPDLYHYSEGIDPVGSWDLMCGTTNPPQHQGMYMKYKYGNWIQDIPDITGQYGTYEIEANSWEGNRRNVYRINTSNPRQYLLIEYRNNKQVFESELPDGGLLIYRIDTRYDGNAGWNGEDQFDEVYLFRPGGSINEAGNLDRANFCADRGRTEFSAHSDPFVFFTNGQTYNWADCIRDVSVLGDKMTFTYCPYTGDGAAPGPKDFIAHVNSFAHQAELSWSAVEDADSYRIYRDGQQIAQGVTETAYVHPYSTADNGYHTYSVASVTDGVVSAQSEQWVIFGNYETIRLSIASDSPYGTKGGEMKVSFSHPDMKTQYFTLYDGTMKESELYVPANTEVTFIWSPGFDPESEGIHVTAKHFNGNGEGTLFDIESPEGGTLATYTVPDSGLGVISPLRLDATSNGPEIQLQWYVPTENQHFDIYRDGRLCKNLDSGYSLVDDKFMHSGTHTYRVESTEGSLASCDMDKTASATAMNYYCEPPQNLEGTYGDGLAELSWEAPQFVGHGMMAYDNNEYTDKIGSNSTKWGIKIEPQHLAWFEGHPLTHIELFDCSAGTYTFTIYNGEMPNNNSTLYTQQQVMEGSQEWVRIALDEVVDYDATQPLWICVSTTGATKPIPCCDYIGEENSCMIKSGANWKPAIQFNMYRTWLLRGYTSSIDSSDSFTYNVYLGPEEGSEEEMVLGYEALTANQAIHGTTENMRYNVTAMWDGRETDFSNTVYLGPSVGIEETTTQSDAVRLYPNPNTGCFTLELTQKSDVDIYNMLSQEVMRMENASGVRQISLENAPKGLYFVRVLSGSGVEVVKVIVR